MLVTMRCDWFISSSASAVLPMKCTKISNKLACVASVSARVCRESWEESKKKKKNDGGGGGERRKCLPANPTILKNCVCGRTGAVLVVLIT